MDQSNRVLRERGFWRAYYGLLLPSAVGQSIFGEADGHAPGGLDLVFPNKMRWRIEPDSETGFCHSLRADEYPDEVAELGWHGPHAALPILRWEEAKRLSVGLASHWDRSPANVAACFVLPLLRPVTTLTTAEQAREAEALLHDAWTQAGFLTPPQRDLLVSASCAVAHVKWLVDPGDPDCGFVTTAKHSLRRAGSDTSRYLKMFLDAVAPEVKDPPRPASARPVAAHRRTWHEGLGADEVEGILRGVRAYRLVVGTRTLRSMPVRDPLDPGFDFGGVHGSFFAVADRLKETPAPAGIEVKEHVKLLLAQMLPEGSQSVLHLSTTLPDGIDEVGLCELAHEALAGCSTSDTDATYDFGAENRLVVDLRRAAVEAVARHKHDPKLGLVRALREVVADIVSNGKPGALWMQPPSERELKTVLAGMHG